MTNWFDDIPEGDLDAATSSRPAEKITFPCEGCGGTGKTLSKLYGSGYTQRRYERTCPVCKGTGSFTTSPEHRAKAATQRANRVASNAEQFDLDHPGLRDFLAGAGSWSDFAHSLYEILVRRASLSEKQLAAALSMKAKCEMREAESKAAQEAKSGAVDMWRIRELFHAAMESGLKKPKLRTEHLTLKLGKDGVAIHVEYDGEYVGKIGVDEFKATSRAPANVLELLIKLAEDPKGITTEYGRITGSCSCCGRTLTDPVSVQAGIGPICASRWGI